MDNNKMKVFKNRLKITLFILIAIIETLFMTTTFAALSVPEGSPNPSGMLSRKKNDSIAGWVTNNDLESEYDIFCCAHRDHLYGTGSATIKGSYGGTTFENMLGYITANDLGKKLHEHNKNSKGSDFNQSSYTHKTFGYYKKIGDTEIANPKEAYIIAEMKKNTLENGKDYPTEYQKAWWTTYLGTKKGEKFLETENNNDIAQEAEAFQNYILNLAGGSYSSSGGTLNEVEGIDYVDQTYALIEDGVEQTGTIKAPEIKYEPKWNDDADQNGEINEADKVTVSFDGDKQEYIVGPFSINYVKDSVQVGNREKVNFANIINADLVSNIGELNYKSDWNFVWLANQQRDLNEGYEYPNPNEVFYISIKYKTGLTSIEKFGFDFKYMNAGAEVDYYEGYYGICTWNAHTKDNYHTETHTSGPDANGNTHTTTKRVYDDTDVWLQLDEYETGENPQDLGHGLIGARWYNYAHLERSWDLGEAGYIRIEKETVNDSGERLEINKTFYFNIYVDGKLFQTLSIQTKDGYGARTSELIKWTGNAPSYRVEEVNYDTEEFIPNGPWTGTVGSGQTISIKAQNKLIQKEGYLEIDKKLINSTPAVEGETFRFKITMTGNFTYDGRKYNATIKNPFEMEVTLNSSTNWKWVSNKFTWEKDAPHYKVEEIVPENAGWELIGIVQGNGYLMNDETKNVTVTNSGIPQKEYDRGRIQLKKVYVDANGNEIKEKVFKFKVTVGSESYIVEIKSGSIWRSGYFYWEKGTSAPTYTVEELEIPEGCTVSIDKPTGILEAEDPENNTKGIIDIIATNTASRIHESRISIDKNIIVNDKLSEDDVTGIFTFNITVTGTFFYNGVSYADTSMNITTQISEDTNWSWTSMPIYWYDKAPTYSVEEIDIPANWKLVEMSSNASGVLEDSKNIKITCTNEWNYIEKLVLTMEIGGKVWDDTDRTQDKHVDAVENGIIDEGEAGISNVFVKVYRAVCSSDGNILTRLEDVYAYDDKNLTTRIDATTYTDTTGNWSIGAISVPAFKDDAEREALENRFGSGIKITYDVEFYYDGQTYEPTTFLATSNGDANKYKNASTSGRDAYLYNSMAIDDVNERIQFNNTFENITGNEAMDENGKTNGFATNSSNDNIKELHYLSVDSASLINADNIRKISTLNTTDENGYIYDDLEMKARTSTGGLTYPFDNKIHLTHWDKQMTDVFSITYYYSATYNYCLSINLGLIEREATDLALEKDLSIATVVVNGKVLKYKYNSAIDLEDPNNLELLYKQIAVADEQIEYNLGLYSSDYYYRASVYNGSTAGEAIDSFYTKVLNLPKETTEMEIFLNYKINIYNQSQTYTARVNEIADYFDSTFELITPNSEYSKTNRYVQTVNGKSVDDVIQIAYPSTVTYYTSGNVENGTYNVDWVEGQNRIGSDGVEYTRMTTNSLRGKTLESGERAEISVTFRVEKDNFNNAGVQDVIKLGKKHNVAEITNFTSFYSNTSKNKWGRPGQIAGRVDEDSAPNNINLEYANEKSYYEDDTDSAPILTISLYDVDRAIGGLVWEDSRTETIEYSQTIGNGLYNKDEGDKIIKGLTTEIIETISIPQNEKDSNGNTIYKEYEFEWPTNTPIQELGGKTIKELTGFDQSVVTNENGEYSFIAIPAGNYRVRFVYGDKEIGTGNSGYEEVYDGQDYKSTAYQIGFNNDSDGDGYTDNEWHDLSNKDLAEANVSDSRDNEARRLYITSKSHTLTYDNSHVLDTADSISQNHNELFGNYMDAENKVTGEGYYMYSETAKINLAVEDIYGIGYDLDTINNVDIGLIKGDVIQAGRKTGTPDFRYVVKKVDCGIEERPQTKLTIDKQIKEIILKTSDNKVILDAIYDISYEIKDDGTIVPTVVLNEEASIGYENIASLNRTSNTQGYRYIMAESSTLQGTTITVKYQMTVFNTSETDRTARLLDDVWKQIDSTTTQQGIDAIINKALSEVSTPYYTQALGRVYTHNNTNYFKAPYGRYFGSIYYLGSQAVGVRKEAEADIIVKTKVHQIVDYVDTDVDFKDTENVLRDQSWLNTTIEYLLDNKLIDPAVVQIIDKNGELTGETRADREANNNERYAIIDKTQREYITENKNNIILNIDNNADVDTATNPDMIRELLPYNSNKNYDESVAKINLEVSRYYSSELDNSDIENIVEIIKTENTVGRRDVRSVAGNANPYALNAEGEPIGEYAEAAKEPDTNATELITLSPPTGLDSKVVRTTQIVLVCIIAAGILAIGIIIIKKKVLTKK